MISCWSAMRVSSLCKHRKTSRKKYMKFELLLKMAREWLLVAKKRLVTIKTKVVLLYQLITRGWSIEAVIIRYFAKWFLFHQTILTIIVSSQRFSFLNSKIQVNYIIRLIELENDALDIFKLKLCLWLLKVNVCVCVYDHILLCNNSFRFVTVT